MDGRTGSRRVWEMEEERAENRIPKVTMEKLGTILRHCVIFFKTNTT